MLPGWIKMRLILLLILAMFGYVLNANWMAEKRYDIVVKDIASLRVEYNQNKDQLSQDVQARFQRIMNIYGTRLTLMEKGVKKYHGVESLKDLTTRKG